MKSIGERIGIYFGVFLALIAVYTGLMTLTFAYDGTVFEERVVYASRIVDEEGEYPQLLYYQGGSMLDNFTDRLMIGKMIKDEDVSALYQGMSVGDYARYWHGYLVWLRPLSLLFDYSKLRLVLSGVNFFLFAAGLLLLHKRFGFKASAAYAFMWFSFYGLTTSSSIQFSTCSILIGLGVIVALRHYRSERAMFAPIFFVMMGSLVNFFDLLTYPLATLTVPLTVMCLIDAAESRKVKDIYLNCVKASFAWALSYGATWIMKWVIGTIVTGSNVLEDALSSGMFRMVGNDSAPIDRLEVLVKAINVPILYRFLPIVCLVCIVIGLIMKRGRLILSLTPLLVISLFPYIWYEVLCNHSMVHSFFTYKAQMGSAFAMVAVSFMAVAGINVTNSGE